MMAALREWLTSIVVVTLLISAAQLLVAEGAIRKVFSFTAGLILLTALLQPVLRMDITRFDARMQDYQRTIGRQQEELEAEQTNLLAEEVARRTAVCIEEKGRTLGLTMTAKVTTAPNVEGVPLPAGVSLSCSYDSRLSVWLEEELSIPAQRQSWDKD